MSSAHYTVLAGGTGAAKFLRGLVRVVPEDQIHVIVNVGDDTDVWGLHVSPDIDSITYALSGRLDTIRGWGLANETFQCLETIEAFGMPGWFRLGDQDLATHLTRTYLLRSGLSLSETVQRMSKAMSRNTAWRARFPGIFCARTVETRSSLGFICRSSGSTCTRCRAGFDSRCTTRHCGAEQSHYQHRSDPGLA
ncbi:MAG: hypothetical protein DMG13_11355 [Acidobacteria bacterium]|nr:MAG: hypothetical protein DMG13_11355 [Acidobacteriota bacterium]